MGVLGGIQDAAFSLGRASKKLGNKTIVKATGGRIGSKATKAVGDDIADAPAQISKNLRNTTIGVAGIAGSTVVGSSALGAYAAEQNADAQGQKSDRYAAYQQRLREIEEMYQNGTISQSQMEEMKREAEQNYRRSNGETPTESVWEVVAEMGTIQLGVVGIIVAIVLTRVLPPMMDAFASKMA